MFGQKLSHLGGNHRYQRAIELYNSSRFEEAIDEFDKVVGSHESVDAEVRASLAHLFQSLAYFKRGQELWQDGASAEAHAYFEKCLNTDPDNVEARLALEELKGENRS
ncbi:MAG: hypothetical protein JW937_10665 [Candidatus Omnitrophica bacterium]|nr:hypothetical protein [Candidatus Omnitrophota bacterium]